ncbi:restriction endonuclease subunit S [Salisediminibacterium halotolerans]|uniref:Type I restriction enzyme, S subunit n=1 Tax=Salisediminibacterium halotolerans TaxID=517425 RepID=A0A1H9T0Q3_9BACI|nr:restriction endonuclease subunit S [Salisediminibacterium haloalkalitolerans]SER90840.1 type I restriction enzyme, S subunit [Salisediminibacterium haloalkalitolerans]
MKNEWVKMKIKYLFRIQNGGTPKSDEISYWEPPEIPWLTPEDLSDKKKYVNESKRQISYLGLSNSSANLISRNSVVMSTRAPIGNPKIVPFDYATNQGCKSLINKDKSRSSSEFLYYSLVANEEIIKIRGRGTTFKELSNYDLNNFTLSFPTLNKQNRIVSFLNQKTTEIDELIADKERLIELLEEKRQAVITETVTKGLDPNVKMKDSGVEWIGEVPEHWEVNKFKKYVLIQEGPGIMAKDFRLNGIPLIRISGVKQARVSLKGCNYLDEETVLKKWDQFRLNVGDLLISASASVNIISEVTEEAAGSIPYTGLIRINTKSEYLKKDFIKYYIQSYVYKSQIELLKTGSTIQHYGPTHLRNFILVIPSIVEQEKIISLLDDKISSIHSSLTFIKSQISKLKEYRQSLIYEAVTGKIDVSDYEVPAESQTEEVSH